MDQEQYDVFVSYLRTATFPSTLAKNEKDSLRRKSKSFSLKDGLLYHRDRKSNVDQQVITAGQKQQVMEGCHSNGLGGGHFGRDKTLSKVSEWYYWLGMAEDVREFCKTCDKCQRANRKFDKFTAELHPIPVKDKVWDTIGVDLVGPLPETARGNKYIMTVSCLFSKWPEAAALPDTTATGVAEFLFQCFTRHGCCSVKITDQGREFVNKVNDELCRLMGVKCNMTSAYHPQSNGLDERFNQTLQRQLLKYVNEEQRDWDLYLDAILFSYRVSRQDSTKMSPFLLVYGRQPRLPVELSINSILENENVDEKDDGCQEGDEDKKDDGSQEEEKTPTDENEKDSGSQQGDEDEKDDGSQEEEKTPTDENEKDSGSQQGDEDEKDDGSQDKKSDLEEHIRKMVTIRRKALENVKVAQERQKVHYDVKHCQDKAKYKVGALVLVKNSRKLSRKGSKMAPNWLGPYRIHEVLSKGTFRLSQVKDAKKVLAQLYNMTRLKLYYCKEDSNESSDDNPPNSPKQVPPTSQSNPPKEAPPKLSVEPTKASPQPPSRTHRSKSPKTLSLTHRRKPPQPPSQTY